MSDRDDRRAATAAQQEAYDACMAVARTLQAGDSPTAAQSRRVRDALAGLKAEPQPAGLTEALEAALRVFVPELEV